MRFFYLLILAISLTACGGGNDQQPTPPITSTPTPSPTPTPTPSPTASPGVTDTLPLPEPLGISTNDSVVVSNDVFIFNHWQYSINSDYTLESVDYSAPTSTQYETTILENNYLRVELLPEFGGRIISIFNKSTGHEELYQNPMGSPYLNDSNIFYYDWLMVMGGIFPTFPEPEHGKAWLRPWSLEVVEAGGEMAVVRMSYQDNDQYTQRPGQFNNGITNIICTVTVTLHAGRSALDIIVSLENPTNESQTYEYWTNTAPAPGSTPGNTRATDGFEIIADITALRPPRMAPGTAYGIVTGTQTWPIIKDFVNHETDGIAYPNPDISHTNFWGAINHDNQEGLFRIADNSLTPGLKIFTFGRDSTSDIDPTGPTSNLSNWQRPFVELWAGTSREFFFDSSLPANTLLNIEETYAPSVAMEDVTHASIDVLANISDSQISLMLLTPDQDYRVVMEQAGTVLSDQIVTPDPIGGNQLVGDFSSATHLRIFDSLNREVFSTQF